MPDCSPLPAAEPAVAREARLLAVLQELTEIGMELARELRREAMAAPEGPAADVGLKFSRIARAVRQSVALEARLAEAFSDAERRQAASQPREGPLASCRRAMEGFERKASAAYLFDREIVEQMAEDAAAGEVDADTTAEFRRMRQDVADWVVDDQDDAAFADKPIGQIICEICRWLGLSPDPEVLSEEAWEAAVRRRYAVLDGPGGLPPGEPRPFVAAAAGGPIAGAAAVPPF